MMASLIFFFFHNVASWAHFFQIEPFIPFTTSYFFFLAICKKLPKKHHYPTLIFFSPIFLAGHILICGICNLQTYLVLRMRPPSILWCSSHTSHHPQEELAKFGYMSKRKVETFRSLLYFDHLIEPIVRIWCFQKNNSSKCGDFGTSFSQNLLHDDRLLRKVTLHFTPYPLFL